jgi:hypothetical protein
MLARGREAERLGATIPKPLGRSRGVIGIQERENWPTTEYEALHIPAYGTTLGAYLADQCKALDGRGGRPTVMQAFLEGPWAHWQTMGGDRWAFPVMFIAKTVAWMRDTNAKAKRDQVTDAGAEKRGITTPAMPQPEAEDPKRKAMRVHWDRLGKDGANLPDFAQWVEDMEHAGVLDELSRLQVDADGLVCLHGAPLSRRPAQGITARLAQEALQVASPEEVAEGFALIRQAVAKTAGALAPSSVLDPVGKKKQQGPRDLSAARALLRAK